MRRIPLLQMVQLICELRFPQSMAEAQFSVLYSLAMIALGVKPEHWHAPGRLEGALPW